MSTKYFSKLAAIFAAGFVACSVSIGAVSILDNFSQILETPACVKMFKRDIVVQAEKQIDISSDVKTFCDQFNEFEQMVSGDKPKSALRFRFLENVLKSNFKRLYDHDLNFRAIVDAAWTSNAATGKKAHASIQFNNWRSTMDNKILTQTWRSTMDN